SQPADFTGPIGATASFTVEATGEGLTYQWQYKSLKDGKWYNANVDGSNTPTMHIGVTGNRDGMQFRCRITDDSNHHVISNAATLRAVTVGPDTVDYGTCGDNLTWTLDENGLLTISGTGDPWSYPFPDGAHLFQDHWEDLHEVVIEPGMTSISESMFEGLYIEHISIPDTVTRIEKKAFSDCTELKECVIPEGVTVIQEWTFRMCHSLETVVIPSTVTSIGGNAFNGCRALTGLILPEGLTAIGDYSFAGCLAFETLTIPSTVTSIGSNAFAYSFDTYYTPEKKPVITFLGNAPAIGDNAFQFVTGTVYYPASDPTWTETVCQNYGGTLTWIMYEPFAITSQPADFTGPIGATASFTVEAAGEGLTYQWQYKSLKDGKWYNANVDGSNTPTMHIGVTGNRDGMQFRCRITDASGSHLISDAATLRVG
ncbi:MAG: leucine-rich repeat domain-containing protein, partial [Oscillospiraceae bacterium]|nr:leucine-rich repeat domain-containing protein [Oscillospiraceae bacterium]